VVPRAGTLFSVTTGQTLSGSATSGTVWDMVKRKSELRYHQLINLIGSDDQWHQHEF